MKNIFKKLPLIIAAIFFIVSCLVFMFLYREISTHNQNTKSETLEWQTEMERRDSVKLLDSSLAQNSSKRDLLESHFMQSSDVVPFLDMIEHSAKSVGASAAVDAVDTGTGNTVFSVSIKAEGSFQAVYKFITLLENSPYELKILSMNLSQVSSGDATQKGVKNSTWQAILKVQLLSFTP